MKYIVIIMLAVSYMTGLSAEERSFTLKADLSGLQKGDTIFICRENLLDSGRTDCDTLRINKNRSFVYKRRHQGGGFYTFTYSPASGSAGRNRSLTLFLNEGTVKLTGDVAHFGMAAKEGGEYDHPLIARYTFLQDSLALAESALYDRYDEAMKKNDSEMLKEVLIEISQGQHSSELDSLTTILVHETNDSEYAAALYVWNSTLFSSADMEDRLTGFTPEVQTSYTSDQIRKIIALKKVVEPGASAPDFTLTDSDGDTVSLTDYKGKYLLIFHWGVSQGSIRINSEIEPIYGMFHDRGLEILDLVQSDVNPGNYLSYSPNLYRQLNPLFHHLWKTVYTSVPENRYVCDSYALNAMPLLILISPEGEILVRNFGKSGEIIRHLSKGLSR